MRFWLLRGLGILATCSVAAAATPDWRFAAQSSEGRGAIDVASITIDGNVRRAWIRLSFFKPYPTGASFMGSTMQRWVSDCSRGTLYVAKSVNYAGRYGDGKVVGSYAAPYPTPEEPVPGSIGAAYLEGICAPEKLIVPEVSVPELVEDGKLTPSTPPTVLSRGAPRDKDRQAADSYAEREALAQAAMWQLIGSKYTSSDEIMNFMGRPFTTKAQVPCVPKAGVKKPERCVEMRWLDGRVGRSNFRFWLQVEDTVEQPLWYWPSDSGKR